MPSCAETESVVGLRVVAFLSAPHRSKDVHGTAGHDNHELSWLGTVEILQVGSKHSKENPGRKSRSASSDMFRTCCVSHVLYDRVFNVGYIVN